MKKIFLFVVIACVLLVMASCKNAEEEQGINVADLLEKQAENLSIDDKALEIGCQFENPSCDTNHTCADNECVLKEGCDYANPECPEIQKCENNRCILKEGCQYDNPSCKQGFECMDNRCVYAVGCNWDNPPCDKFKDCVNNECVPKKGCANDNPPCEWGQSCQNNVCIGTASGVLHTDDFDPNLQWANMQDVNESGVDLGQQKD